MPKPGTVYAIANFGRGRETDVRESMRRCADQLPTGTVLAALLVFASVYGIARAHHPLGALARWLA